MENYKNLFTISRSLLKNNIPDDLIPIFFEYLGNLNESVTDLKNKHCWAEIKYYDLDDKFDRTFGHYCFCCNELYLLHTDTQLKRHALSKNHIKKLKKHDISDKIFATRLERKFRKKCYSWFCRGQAWREKALATLKIEKITLR